MCSRRTSWISVRYQTLCLGVACLLFILYKYFPSLFSLILNSYPLIICTTIFLGILSRYRKPDAPKKEDDRKTRRSSSLKIQSVENSLRAKKEESFKLKAHVGSRRTFKKMTIRTIVSGDTIHSAPSKGIEDSQVDQMDAADVASSSSVDRKSLTEDEEHSRERLGEGLQSPACSGEKNTAVLDVDADKTKSDQYIDSCLGSPWYHVDHQDASLGSEFDHQDPSVVNAAPILGELDPHISKGVSDDNSASFSQNHVMDEGTEAENQDGKGAQEERDDGNRVGVTWSADDKRKLMDLGDSEVERNRRLENLIARRRARKAMEKNIIDLDNSMETSESHGQLPPMSINAPRRNLFGLPYDLDESIPGSAPSILLPRRNPFDLPYEQVDDEESWGRNEFVTIPQRDILLRRHESFTIGASLFFGGFEQDWYCSRFGSCVGEEKNEPQDTVHADLRGLLGEVSDSEMNSTLESDSVSSVANQEHQKDLCRESESPAEEIVCQMNLNTDQGKNEPQDTVHADLRELLCEVSDSEMSSTLESDSVSTVANQKDLCRESETPVKHQVGRSEQDSQSSEDTDSMNAEQIVRQMNLNNDQETQFTEHIDQATEDSATKSNREREEGLCQESDFPQMHKVKPDEQDGKSSKDAESMDVEQVECQMNMKNDHETQLSTERIHQNTEDYGAECDREHQKDSCRENDSPEKHKTKPTEQDVGRMECQMNVNNDHGAHLIKDIYQATEDFGAESNHEHQKDLHLESESFKTHKAEPDEQGSQSSEDIEQLECQMNMIDDQGTHLMTTLIHQTTEDLGDVKGDISKKLISCSPISYAEREVADEKCESNSPISSEVERNSPKTSTHEQTVNIEQINHGSCRGLTVSTESIAIGSDVANVEAEKVHDSHVEESLSISSPTATRKSHSNSSVADEKCDSSSSIPSTAEKNSAKIGTHEKTVDLEQKNSGSCKGLTVFTDSIAVDFDDANVEAEKAHDSHIVEPISNSSPTATRKSHPDSSLVDEKCESNSSIPLESEKNSHQMSDHEQTVDIEQISSSYCKGLAILTESFAVNSDVVNVEAEKIHDSHIMEPDSNCSPTATRKSHSNSLLDEAHCTADKEGSTYNQSLASGTDTSLSVVGSIMKTAETDKLPGGKTEDILSLSFKDEDDSVSRGLSIIKESNVI